MKKTTLYKLMIVLLLLMNSVLLVFVFKQNGPMHPPHKRKSILSIVTNFTPKTKQKIAVLEQMHFKQKDALMNESSRLHRELFQQLNQPTSTFNADSIIALIAKNHRKNEQLTFDYFIKIGTFCSAEQKNKLQHLIHGAFNRMQGKQPHPPGK